MTLKESLEAASIYYPQGGTTHFLPRGTLDDLLNETLVFSELWNCLQSRRPSPDETTRLAKIVCYGRTGSPGSSFRKIFSVLVLGGIVPRIVEFIENNIDDSSLPMLRESVSVGQKAVAETVVVGTGLLSVKNNNNYVTLGFMHDWDPGSIDALFKEQWSFLAPFFESVSGEVNHYNLTAYHILPVISDLGLVEETPLGSELGDSIQEFSSLTKVTRIKLHPRHYSFGGYIVSFLWPRDLCISKRNRDRNIPKHSP